MDEDDRLALINFIEESSDSDSSQINGDSEAVVSSNNAQNSSREERRHASLEGKIDVLYDTSLPAQHNYLGTDLEELSGRTVLDDDSLLQLPLVILPGIILVPGQTLPLHLFNPAMVSMVKKIIEKDRTFGMVNCRYLDPDFTPSLACIGTTAEVRSFREEDDASSGISSIRVKAEGRQRFRVLEAWRQIDGCWMAKVQVMPEILLSDAGEGARLESLNRFRLLPNNFDKITMKMEKQGQLCVLRPKPSRRKYDRHDFANYTRWPPWVYKQYDALLLMQRVRKELRGWGRMANTEQVVPDNPSEYSFWVAANLPLDDTLRLRLLSFNSPIQRLRCALSILQKCTVLCCKHCDLQIASRHDIFSMSLEGPQGTYVNPNGYVHETITCHKAQGLTLNGEPSDVHSWFPGYAWTIAQCRNCHSHMGWRFTATKANLQPVKFWGLCRSSLEQGLSRQEWMPVI